MKKSNTLLMVHVENSHTFKQAFDAFQQERTLSLKERRELKVKNKLDRLNLDPPENSVISPPTEDVLMADDSG